MNLIIENQEMLEVKATQLQTHSDSGDSYLDKERPKVCSNTNFIGSVTIGMKWNYFITIAFPQNHHYSIKHLVPNSRGNLTYSFDLIRYGDCLISEQYEWVTRLLNKYIRTICSKCDIFFEQTKEGVLHLHGRLRVELTKSRKPLASRTVKLMLHRLFDTPPKYKHFVDIKPYDESKWSDYANKTTKTYQTLDYPHLII